METAILLIAAYLVGNLLTATVVGKLFYKQDIRVEGSGNPGARNAGRVLGKTAFTVVFLGDAFKCAIVVLIAKWMGMDEWLQLVCVLIVMAGHIYPIVHKFRGGQGVSSFIGGMLAFNPLVVACFVVVFLVFYPFLKSFTLVGIKRNGTLASFPVRINEGMATDGCRHFRRRITIICSPERFTHYCHGVYKEVRL